MAACSHSDLEYIGEQKTDKGTNTFFRCKGCGEVVILTPEKKAFGVKGVN